MEKQELVQLKVQNTKQRNKMDKEKKQVKKKAKPVQEETKPVQEEVKKEEKPIQEEAKPVQEETKPVQEKPKKTEVRVKGMNIPISTKEAADVCKFIKNKKIAVAISDLQEVLAYKKAVPMRGEIPHRKGKIMAGRYPQKSSECFIKLLKSLNSNATANNMEEPKITEAFANIASRPYGRFGRVRKKRTHLVIIAKEKNIRKKK